MFARVITEGLFGLRAVDINKLRIKPQLSKDCPSIGLYGIRLFSKSFDVFADDNGITIKYSGKIYKTDSDCAVFNFDTCLFE